MILIVDVDYENRAVNGNKESDATSHPRDISEVDRFSELEKSERVDSRLDGVCNLDVASCGSSGGFMNIVSEERRHGNYLENKIEDKLNNEEPRVEASSIG